MKIKQLIMLAALFAALAVVIGAFSAHALQQQLSAKELQWIATATEYQQYHALALLAVALLMICNGKSKGLMLSSYAFIVAIVLFSGSLYFLAFSGSTALVYLTPLGGLAFIIGWLALFCAAAGSQFKLERK